MAGAGERAMTDRLLLLTVSVVSLNAALLASASAETCVTGVNPTFAKCRKRHHRPAGHDCGDGRNADNGIRFDECDGQSRARVVLNQCGTNQCDSQSSHRKRTNQCDSQSGHRKRGASLRRPLLLLRVSHRPVLSSSTELMLRPRKS
jgi:hypothetical protein